MCVGQRGQGRNSPGPEITPAVEPGHRHRSPPGLLLSLLGFAWFLLPNLRVSSTTAPVAVPPSFHVPTFPHCPPAHPSLGNAPLSGDPRAALWHEYKEAVFETSLRLGFFFLPSYKAYSISPDAHGGAGRAQTVSSDLQLPGQTPTGARARSFWIITARTGWLDRRRKYLEG